MSEIIAIVIWFIILSIYLYPTTKAFTENRKNLPIIAVINTLTWFTIIWWIIAYIIARNSDIKEWPTLLERMDKYTKENNIWKKK